jgi:hypothetical protein
MQGSQLKAFVKKSTDLSGVPLRVEDKATLQAIAALVKR